MLYAVCCIAVYTCGLQLHFGNVVVWQVLHTHNFCVGVNLTYV
jgi:hypothetical protein